MSYITITDRNDGFGAQFQHILFGIMYAEQNGLIYAHKPISTMDHNYNEDIHFIENIEDFINIRNNFKTIHEIPNYNVIDFWTLYTYIVNNFDKCLEQNKARLKSIFWENKKNNYKKVPYNEVPYNEGSPILNVAVHIRRFNKCDWDSSRIDSNSYFLNLIQKIRETHPENKIFHIYSQGDEDNFKEFIQDDIVFHLNEDVRDTFMGLVSSDILITSKSAMSYCAAILTDGIVYFNKFGDLNPPYYKWIL
jgi:hypothetical protein